jgi:hypothetical protein
LLNPLTASLSSRTILLVTGLWHKTVGGFVLQNAWNLGRGKILNSEILDGGMDGTNNGARSGLFAHALYKISPSLLLFSSVIVDYPVTQ